MEKIKENCKKLSDALRTLEKALDNFSQADKYFNPAPDHEDDLKLALRDSIIQRFEYCVDFLSKYLQQYLEEVEKKQLERKSPRAIFRYCHQVGILSEQEAEQIMEMVECRNKTSHLYEEEISDFVAKLAPEHYELMKKIIERTKI